MFPHYRQLAVARSLTRPRRLKDVIWMFFNLRSKDGMKISTVIESVWTWLQISGGLWLGLVFLFHGSLWGITALVLSFVMAGLRIHSNVYVH